MGKERRYHDAYVGIKVSIEAIKPNIKGWYPNNQPMLFKSPTIR
jgi:hypothetical protein